jgi:hypothetical protein
VLLRERGDLEGVVNENHLHDLGKLLFDIQHVLGLHLVLSISPDLVRATFPRRPPTT